MFNILYKLCVYIVRSNCTIRYVYLNVYMHIVCAAYYVYYVYTAVSCTYKYIRLSIDDDDCVLCNVLSIYFHISIHRTYVVITRSIIINYPITCV